jgi:hypothetical protein
LRAAIRESFQNERKALRGTGGFDAKVGRVLGQMELLCAVGEKGRAAFAEIQLARVELQEQRDEMSRRVAFVLSGAAHLCKQIVIGELIERRDRIHDPFVASSFRWP